MSILKGRAGAPKSQSLIQGSITRGILSFALPLFLGQRGSVDTSTWGPYMMFWPAAFIIFRSVSAIWNTRSKLPSPMTAAPMPRKSG